MSRQPPKPPFFVVINGGLAGSQEMVGSSPLAMLISSVLTPGMASEIGASSPTTASSSPSSQPGEGARFSNRLGTPGGNEIVSYGSRYTNSSWAGLSSQPKRQVPCSGMKVSCDLW